ncbi:hypothetical protein B0H11DRAFT_2261587 [Mycena galericulata]|nr:hypothetical protein B0H11DRAFT_2261587 [Mycena galericulata]
MAKEEGITGRINSERGVPGAWHPIPSILRIAHVALWTGRKDFFEAHRGEDFSVIGEADPKIFPRIQRDLEGIDVVLDYNSGVASGRILSQPNDISHTMAAMDLLKNRSNGVDRTLGPFEGRVGAHITILGTPCFVTTHAHYIPEISAAGPTNTMSVRQDMRYGTDDYGRWPQQYSVTYCHLGAIPRKPVDPNDSLAVMWWDPAPL